MPTLKYGNFAVYHLLHGESMQVTNFKFKNYVNGSFKKNDVCDNIYWEHSISKYCSFFFQDIILLLMLSFLCGWLSSTLGLPTMFGYIVAGLMLGSSGLNLIKVRQTTPLLCVSSPIRPCLAVPFLHLPSFCVIGIKYPRPTHHVWVYCSWSYA